MFTRIVVPLETLSDPLPLFEAAGKLALGADARVILCSTTAQEGRVLRHWQALYPEIRAEFHRLAGQLAPAILEELQRDHADLLVMGSSCGPGHQHLGRVSITEQVVLGSCVPTLLIRHQGTLSTIAAPRPLHLLALLDNTMKSTEILDPLSHLVSALALTAPSDVHLLKVVRPADTTTYPSPRMTMLPHPVLGRLVLESQADQLRGLIESSIPVTIEVVIAQDVGAALLARLSEGHRSSTDDPAQPWDLVAMSVVGPLGDEPAPGESVIQRILHATYFPYFVKCSRVQHEWPYRSPVVAGTTEHGTAIDTPALVHAIEALGLEPEEIVGVGD